MKIIAISGSLRAKSYNTLLLQAVRELASDDMEIEIVSLVGIPLYNGDEEAEHGVPESVNALADKIRRADAVIIATPEYNYSIPGVLKNATDWISRIKDHPLKNKMVGVMGASLGPTGTARAQYPLRQNLQGLESWVMPKPEIFLGLAQQKFSDDGTLTDEPTRSVIKTWLEAFSNFAGHGA